MNTKLLNPSIELQNVSFFRGERIILNNVSLSIPKGKITAIMGPSGCGKTTLLKLMAGQITPDSGLVKVLDNEIFRITKNQLYKLRKKIGMLFQSGALFTDVSVFDNVAFPLREHMNLPETMIRDLVLIKLEAVGLRGAANLMPGELSGGMTRRVALARATILDPEIIMYDEPFAGQDPISMGVLVKLIKMLNQLLGITSVIVSHDIRETLGIADYVYLISEHKIVGEGAPKELHKSQDPWISQFLHALPDGPVPFHYPAVDYYKDLIS